MDSRESARHAVQTLILERRTVEVARKPWPDPTPEQLASPEFEAIWQVIKRWDINVPDVYFGYMGATGNHVRAILDALMNSRRMA